MKEIKITENDAGQRLDKFLLKYLNRAPSSLIHKYLRKKDIRLNGKRAQGNEHLVQGDVILIRLSDDMISNLAEDTVHQTAYPHVHVLYEDEHILILNKPAGILTQKASGQDISLNEEMLSYLLDTGAVTRESLQRFRPSVCNRLDRNTAGIVLCAKTLPAAQGISELLRTRSIQKYYQCIVTGVVSGKLRVEGWLIKDKDTNHVRILERPADSAARIETGIMPLKSVNGYSLLEIELITGKTHQIRAQMAALGHPIAGDAKYGGSMKGLRHQALAACRVVFPSCSGALYGISARTIEAPLPSDFRNLMHRLGLN